MTKDPFLNKMIIERNKGRSWLDIGDDLGCHYLGTIYPKMCREQDIDPWRFVSKHYKPAPRRKRLIERCVKYRKQGMRWADIAEAMGLTSAESAKAYFHNACRKAGLTPRELLHG